MRTSILIPQNIHVFDVQGNEYFGCDQNWYKTTWQQIAGCGPSVAANILLYQQKSGRIKLPFNVQSKEDFVALMEEVWKYVTPSKRGLFVLKHFCEGIHKLLHSLNEDMPCFALPISSHIEKRPTIDQVIEFITTALKSNCPIAYLNLSSGNINNLPDWHWMTVIALEIVQNPDEVYLELYDNAEFRRINMNHWLSSTTLGGGFIYFK
jgi:hypothetical protein